MNLSVPFFYYVKSGYTLFLHDEYIQITDIDNHDTDRISGLPA